MAPEFSFTVADFCVALRTIRKPGGRQLEFLRLHSQAPGRALTVRRLAEQVGYRNYRGINLHYGKLARTVGTALGHPDAGIKLLAAVAEPGSLTNREWILIMKPEFEAALRAENWI